jgi:hypothetical protein
MPVARSAEVCPEVGPIFRWAGSMIMRIRGGVNYSRDPAEARCPLEPLPSDTIAGLLYAIQTFPIGGRGAHGLITLPS